jgi:hypothetical protein
MKNRKRESCTSGTVRDEDGNILIYSARPMKVARRALGPASANLQGETAGGVARWRVRRYGDFGSGGL